MKASEILAVQALLARFSHAVDDRDAASLAEIFDPDAVLDLTGIRGSVIIGRAEIVDHLVTGRQPLAHHCTNILVEERGDGTVRCRSKGLGVLRKGTVGSVTYEDEVISSPGGWRLTRRAVVLHEPTEADSSAAQ